MKHSELRHQPRHVNPRIQDVGVIFTLLGRLQIIDDPVGQRAQTAAVFLGGLPDGCLVTPQVQRDDAAVIHGVHLLPVLIEGPSPL